jgi:hypothetical protein
MQQRRITMFFFQEGFTYRNFLLDALAIFFFIVWFWLLITVASDLFRRHDISGWVKAIWVINWIVFPYVAVLHIWFFKEEAWRNATSDKLRRPVMNSGAWLVSASRMKSKNWIG